MTKTENGISGQAERTQLNWVTIAILGVAIVIFSNQKGCNLDLSKLLPPKNTVSDSVLLIPEPPNEFKTSDLEAFRLEVGKNSEKAANLAAFYYAFADLISRNPDFIQNTQDFRNQHANALDLMFKNDPKLSSPEVGAEIEAFLDDFIDKTPQKLDLNKLKSCLLAIAWAAKNA